MVRIPHQWSALRTLRNGIGVAGASRRGFSPGHPAVMGHTGV